MVASLIENFIKNCIGNIDFFIYLFGAISALLKRRIFLEMIEIYEKLNFWSWVLNYRALKERFFINLRGEEPFWGL